MINAVYPEIPLVWVVEMSEKPLKAAPDTWAV